MKRALFACVLVCTLCLSAALAAEPAADNKGPKPGLYAWAGEINGKIPVAVWFAVEDGVVAGELTYTKTGSNKPIRLLGTLDLAGGLELREMLPDGTISGYISIGIKSNAPEGTWRGAGKMVRQGNAYDYKEGKTFPLTLRRADLPAGAKGLSADMGKVVGNYSYSYGKDQGRGASAIHALNESRVRMDFDANIAAPSYNMARVEAMDCPWKGRSFLCEIDEGCAVTVRVFDGFMVVGMEEERNCAGSFGHGAHVAGIYIKTAK
jgi:Uncharacterized protein conserved in bacteria